MAQPVRGAGRLTRLALLTAIALTIFLAEAQLPVIPIPGVKLGLANIVTVYTMFVLGPGDALLVLSARVFLGAVFSGQMMTLIYSAAGGFLRVIGCPENTAPRNTRADSTSRASPGPMANMT